MGFTTEEENQIRLWIRQEINKAFGSIIVAARKTNINEIRNLASNTRFLENTLLKGLHQAEAELTKGRRNGNNSPENKLSTNERLGTYDG